MALIIKSEFCLALPQVVLLQPRDVVSAHRRIVGIDVVQPFQKPVGLSIIALKTVESDFTFPQPGPVGGHLQQLVDVANRAGIVAGLLLDVDQQALGRDIIGRIFHGTYQIIAGIVVVLEVVVVTTGQLIQFRGFGIAFKPFLQNHHPVAPFVGSEEFTHRLPILFIRLGRSECTALAPGRNQQQQQKHPCEAPRTAQ